MQLRPLFEGCLTYLFRMHRSVVVAKAQAGKVAQVCQSHVVVEYRQLHVAALRPSWHAFSLKQLLIFPTSLQPLQFVSAAALAATAAGLAAAIAFTAPAHAIPQCVFSSDKNSLSISSPSLVTRARVTKWTRAFASMRAARWPVGRQLPSRAGPPPAQLPRATTMTTVARTCARSSTPRDRAPPSPYLL